jgi:hypothetical protein
MRAVALIISAFGLITSAHAVDISVTGDWSTFVDSADLTYGAGSDLRTTLESDIAQTTIDITNSLLDVVWTVKVRKSDIDWPSGVNLAVSLTDNGSGLGLVSGSGDVTVTNTDQVFVTGLGDRYGMKLRFRLTGQSVSNLPPDSYNTSITYTVE